MVTNVLFVCTGNTCRSSMAQGLARAGLESRGLVGKIVVLSAGTATISGLEASEHAVAALREMGVDISGHRSSMVTPELVERSHLILTMTGRHRNYIRENYDGAAEKTFTLAEYAGGGADIADPYGRPVEAYRECAASLKYLIALTLDKLAGKIN